MPILIQIVIFYIILLFVAPTLAKKIATIIGTIIFAMVLFYLSEKYNNDIQSWQPYTIFGLTFAPLILIWVRYYASR